MKTQSLCLVPFLFFMNVLNAQTISLTLNQADSIFLRNNYSLLLAKYNIDAAKAAKEQAALWDNPNLSVQANAYNGITGKFFPFPSNQDLQNPTGGAVNFYLQQMISLSGQRHKLVAIAQSNVQLQQIQFNQVMRDIRATIAVNFFGLYYTNQKLALITKQTQQLDTLLSKMKSDASKQVFSPYDITRIEMKIKDNKNTFYIQLQQYNSFHNTLKTYLGMGDSININALASGIPENAISPEYDWLQIALNNRSEVKYAGTNIQLQQQSVRYMQSLSIPKTGIGIDYERIGNAYPKYYALQITSDLPVFDRNQGNIKMAKYQAKQAEANAKLVSVQIQNDVTEAIQNYLFVKQQIETDTNTFTQNLEQVQQNATRLYGQRQMSLIEFMDKLESTLEAQSNQIDLQKNYIQALITINQVTESPVFKIN